MKARSTSVATSTMVPHLSRIIQIINLGEQPGFQWEGQDIEPQHKIEFVFEISDEKKKDGRPFFVSKEVNNTDSDKGTLYNWMQAAGTDCNNIQAALGVAVMMTPKLKKSGWPTVDVVAGLPPSMQDTVPSLVDEAIFFDYDCDEPDMEAYAKLQDSTKEKIMKAAEIETTRFYALLAEQDDI